MQNSFVLCTNSTHYQPSSSCVLFHSLCFGVPAVCCEGFDICGQGQQTVLNLLTLWYVLPLNRSYFEIVAHLGVALVSSAGKCCAQCVNVKGAGVCASSVSSSADLYVLFSTWFLSVLSVLIHSSSCMHSCDVSLCVGSRGAWSEVHVGQYGSAVVMTIILLITAAQKRWLGVLDGVVLLFGKVSSFALHGRPVVTIGLHFVITKNFVISKVFFHQSGQSPKIIRAKGVGLERTDSQTVGEFPRGRRKGRYSTLNCHLKTFHSVSKTLTRLFACYQ